ncbi:MAG: outer membrane protein assembly factor BamA, partial [Candidatus Dadabacteria bacterium]
ITGSGYLSEDQLEDDKNRIKQFLLDKGLLDAKVSKPVVKRKKDGLEVVFFVDEGKQYKIGEITASGDLIDNSVEKTISGIKIKKGDVFSVSAVRRATFKISEKYGDLGYAFANVIPQTRVDKLNALVDLNFLIDKGKKVKINRIEISGNTKTYDYVIRRELEIAEQEQYSLSKINRSKALLRRLGYFDEVNINTKPVGEDKVDLEVRVKEGPTGSFSIGGGFSSTEGLIFTSRISENNFLGMGYRLVASVDIGNRSDNFILSFENRRLYNSYLSLSTDAFVTKREFSDFDRKLKGGALGFGYPFERWFTESTYFKDVRGSIKYRYLRVTIDNVNPEDAAPFVIESQGTTTASAIIPEIVRNTVDNPLDPTEGSKQDLSLELAGPGGNARYYLAEFRHRQYYPLLKTSRGPIVFSWRGIVGFGDSFKKGEKLPLFKRFFPGGINSIRGFKSRTLGPKDEKGNEFGGSKEVIGNFELIFPIATRIRLKGIVFYDLGQAFDDGESITVGALRHAAGFGFRWFSPLGPIRIEFGIPLDRQEGESKVVTQFSFGSPL